MRGSTARLQRAARQRADDEARRIPWQRLLDTQNQYIDWQEFYLWVRSVLEVEDRIPDWLVEILNTRVPGFIETESALSPKAIKRAPDEQSTGARVKHGNVDTDPFVAARAHNIGLLAEITGAQRYQGSLQTDSK